MKPITLLSTKKKIELKFQSNINSINQTFTNNVLSKSFIFRYHKKMHPIIILKPFLTSGAEGSLQWK